MRREGEKKNAQNLRSWFHVLFMSRNSSRMNSLSPLICFQFKTSHFYGSSFQFAVKNKRGSIVNRSREPEDINWVERRNEFLSYRFSQPAISMQFISRNCTTFFMCSFFCFFRSTIQFTGNGDRPPSSISYLNATAIKRPFLIRDCSWTQNRDW